jgi:hypothetical protein
MITDIHGHLVGMRQENGCYLHPRMLGGFMYWFLVRALGLGGVERERLDQAYREQLLRFVEESELERVALLPLDGVYDQRGDLDRDRTNVLVGNDYCLEVCRLSPKLVPACSINPQRRDALDELERVSALGAAALKVVPNSQAFDPGDPRYRPFWKRVADLGLPLLSHASFEHTIPVYDQSFGRPERLRPALECGVTVIAAHCATAGVTHLHEDYPTWLAMLKEFPNLYGDISSMASPARFPYIRRVTSHELARERILLGSDYPVLVLPLLFLPRLGFSRVRQLGRIRNPLQRNLSIFRALGVGEDILRRASRLLRLPPAAPATSK